MKLQNLWRADFSDVVNRGWQELWRNMDRLALTTMPAGVRTLGLFEHVAPPATTRRRNASAERHWSELSAFRRDGAARFFAGTTDGGIPALLAARVPDYRTRALAAAEAACAHSFSLLGHRALYLGENLDWHRDAVSGKRAPFRHWSLLNPLDAATIGDSKVIWELNRHQWFVHLGQAYRLTGDERFAREFAASIRHWLRANPPGMGINWASSLEVAYRLISWCWALHLFRDSAALTPELWVELRTALRAHGAHVEKYPSHYFSPNTHLTGEALGLFYAGVLFPELPRAERWKRLGARILLEQLPRQVLPDGTYFEFSTCYERYTAEIYLHFLILAGRNGIELPVTVAKRIQLMLDHLLALCRPDGGMPQLGDSDGGRLLPLAQRSADDCRDVFSLAAAFFGRGDYARAAQGLTPEVAWLLGAAGCAAFDALAPEAPVQEPSRLFGTGGQAVMRADWEEDAHQLLFDVGPLGCRVSGGHGHADLLSVQCSVFGRPQLVDAGTYCYTANPAWRDHFRGSAAHNTLLVDRKSQARPRGPFSWRERPAVRLRSWQSTALYDYADAEHHAYRRLPDPVGHRRRVLYVKPRYWLVVDEVTGRDVHQLDFLFQFAPLDVRVESDGWICSRAADGSGLCVRAFAAQPLDFALHRGEIDPIRGWISPDYGLRVPAPLLRYTAVTPLPLTVATLLVPRDRIGEPLPDVTLQQGAGRLSLVIDDGRETLRIEPHSIGLERLNVPVLNVPDTQ